MLSGIFLSMQNLIHIENIGEVLFRRQKRLVRLSMRLSTEGQIIVNVPFFVSMSSAKKWVISNSKWIECSKLKQEERKESTTIFKPGMQYKTYKHTVCIVEGESSRANNILNLGIPKEFTSNIESSEVQDIIKTFIIKVYTKEAKEILPIRVCELADKHKFNFNKLTCRNNKSRWGSCSWGNNISLNIHLMRLPAHLIDYVILHELCHIKEKNHSESFWKHLETVCPNSKQYRKEMKAYSTSSF
jgi:predicted metal-dependent hydrolase